MIEPEALAASLTGELDDRLAEADAVWRRATRASGRAGSRCTRRTCPRTRTPPTPRRAWGREALAALDEHADMFASVVGDADVIRRVKAKLAEEPLEDLRIDFEDGYRQYPRPGR